MLDHLDDLESDFRVFHRIDDMYSIPGPLFFKLAFRIPAYGGVMRALVEAELAEEQGDSPGPGMQGQSDAREVPATPGALNYEFGDLIEVASADG